MSTEEDRDVRSMAERTADERFPEMVLAPENEQRAEDFSEGYVAGYAAGSHRTPAPASDVQALIADARSRAESLRRMFPNDGETWDDARLVERLADAIEALVKGSAKLPENSVLEALVKERDQAIRDLDAGFAESDHLSAKYYQRWRDAEKHARMRASESADLERERDELAAEVERLKLVHVGQARLAISAVYLADVDDDEGVQAFYREWVRNHDAALIESLADELFVIATEEGLPEDFYRGMDYGADEAMGWLRERARQVREGEA